ncbi:MAG TPA: squalene--hopene cyclase [Lacipirellulaceae bacterium]
MFAPPLAATFLERLGSVPVLYWLLWIGSFALSISLLVVLRTRWAQSRPLQKCAVLSLLVHAMLACLAMTVRVVVGEGGGGSGGTPIRVRIVSESGDSSTRANVVTEVTAAPALLEPPAEEAQSAPPADVAQEVAEPVDAPPLFEPPPIATKTNIAETTAATDQVQEPEAPIETTAKPVPAATASTANVTLEQPSATSTDPSQVATAIAATPVTAASPPVAPHGSSAYSMRGAPGRLGLIEWQGGNAQTEAAVVAALGWLARSQSSDGRWDAARFGAGQEQRIEGHDRGGAGRNADTGISALAILAFLGAGHSHQQGDYQDTVRRGLEFLIRSQAADGSLFGDSTLYAQMYCHSMATFALAEALAMTSDSRLQPAVTKAIAYSLRAQHTTTGGWRYRPNEIGDTSQLGWQMMALASAKRAGLEISSLTWTRVGRFLQSVRRGQHGGLASYRPDGPPSTSMTAEALYCRLLLAEMGGEEIDELAASEATRQLLATLPNRQRVNLYYWYYATLGLHHRSQSSDASAAAWRAWNDAITTVLLESQLTTGSDAGSWNTNTIWGGYGGRVYTTAMAAMCLEAYYRYAPQAAPERWTANPEAAGVQPH